MAQALDEPLRVVPRDELGDERARLFEGFEAVEVQALSWGQGGRGWPDRTLTTY